MKLRIADAQTGETSEAAVFVAAMGLSQYVFAKVYRNERVSTTMRAMT